eukprot:m.58596 g.58596  ORF g.58596 m.58596 type:complete len:419 (+) comp7831_c0_seq2:45-1301(+)
MKLPLVALMCGAVGCMAQNDVLYALTSTTTQSQNAGPKSLSTVDPSTGALTLIGDTGMDLNDLAYDFRTCTLWGITSRKQGGVHPCLVTLDTDTGAATTIGCSSSGASHFLTIDPEDGTLYSQSISRNPDPDTNALRRWVQDSNTLAWSDVVVGSLPAFNGGSLAFADSGVLYATSGIGPASLFTIDPNTAAITAAGTVGTCAKGDVRPGTTQIWCSVTQPGIPEPQFQIIDLVTLVGSTTSIAVTGSSAPFVHAYAWGTDGSSSTGTGTSGGTGMSMGMAKGKGKKGSSSQCGAAKSGKKGGSSSVGGSSGMSMSMGMSSGMSMGMSEEQSGGGSSSRRRRRSSSSRSRRRERRGGDKHTLVSVPDVTHGLVASAAMVALIASVVVMTVGVLVAVRRTVVQRPTEDQLEEATGQYAI